MLCNDLKGKDSIPIDVLIPQNRLSRNWHPTAFQTLTARVNIYQFIFNFVRDWNEASTLKMLGIYLGKVERLKLLVLGPGEKLSSRRIISEQFRTR